MSKETKTRIRIWPSLDQQVYDDLKEIADNEHRKVPDMASILIENAIKERNRKKKGKENN
jgi:hypothetical protein